MKYRFTAVVLLFSVFILQAQTSETKINIDHNWNLNGKQINLPYDLSVAGYRGTATLSRVLSAADVVNNEYVAVVFGGSYGRSDLYINDVCLGQMPASNLPSSFELTPFLKHDGRDSLKIVFSDASGGAGIFQDVDVVCKSAVHFVLDGITTAQSIIGNDARLVVNSKVENTSGKTAKYAVRHILMDPKGTEVASSLSLDAEVVPQGVSALETDLTLSHPQLWSPSSPVLYTLVSRVEALGVVQDEEICKIGFRTLDYYDATGFLLNGQAVDIHPFDYQQTYLGLGGAISPRYLEHQLNELKQKGCNMVSTGGMPASGMLLSLCDSLGIMVLDEVAESGINDSQKQAAASMVARSVNHPSVVLWGAGRDAAPAVARKFSDYLHTMDGTRKTVLLSGEGRGWHSDETGTSLLQTAPFSTEIGYRQMAEWAKDPVAYMDPEWSLAGHEGKQVNLTVYSNCDRVNLGVNGINYSSAVMVDGKAEWHVVYRPGRIDLTGYKNNKIVLKKTYTTHGYGYQIKATPSKLKLKPDGQDIIVMDIQMLDSKGTPTPDANMNLHVYVDDNALNAYGIVDNTNKIHFSGLEILGYRGNEASVPVKDGKARLVLRSVKGSSGIAHVRIGGESLHGASFNINYE